LRGRLKVQKWQPGRVHSGVHSPACARLVVQEWRGTPTNGYRGGIYREVYTPHGGQGGHIGRYTPLMVPPLREARMDHIPLPTPLREARMGHILPYNTLQGG